MKGITKKLIRSMTLIAVFGLASCSTSPVNDGDTSSGSTSGGGTHAGGTDNAAKVYYVVQLIASSDPSKAESIKNQFVGEGYKAYVSALTSGGQTFHRVQIGPYGTELDATRVLNQMKRRYHSNTHVNSAVVKTVNGS